MFFMIGVHPLRKDYEYNGGLMICNRCRCYGSYRVYMTCMCLYLFFIPCFKWQKTYFAQSTCCNTTYLLDPEIGKRIARGESVTIQPEHLQRMQSESQILRCPICGYTTSENFSYCPKCGHRF